MKTISLIIFSVVLITVFSHGRTQLTSDDPYTRIRSMLTRIGVDCNSIRSSPRLFCYILGLLPQYKICLQDFIDYLIKYCRWDCDLVLRFVYNCGCFSEIMEKFDFSYTQLVTLIKQHDCNINDFLQWLMCKYGLSPDEMAALLEPCPFCFEPDDCGSTTTEAPTTTVVPTNTTTCHSCCELHGEPCDCIGSYFENPKCENDSCANKKWICKAPGMWACC